MKFRNWFINRIAQRNAHNPVMSPVSMNHLNDHVSFDGMGTQHPLYADLKSRPNSPRAILCLESGEIGTRKEFDNVDLSDTLFGMDFENDIENTVWNASIRIIA